MFCSFSEDFVAHKDLLSNMKAFFFFDKMAS